MREIDPAERHYRRRLEPLVALELALRQGLPHRLLDLALGAHTERFRNLRMLTLKTSSFIIASMLRLAASALWRISRPAGLQVDRLAATGLKFKKVGATTRARG